VLVALSRLDLAVRLPRAQWNELIAQTVDATLSDRVPIPPKDTINTNLSSATERIMLRKFGQPGTLTKNCSLLQRPGRDGVRRSSLGRGICGWLFSPR